MVYVVMGVAGSGKTTVGTMLAGRLDLPFYDADDFHPPDNIRKMRDGIPLTDADREPWLEVLSERIGVWSAEGGAVLACSALKEAYRRVLLRSGAELRWIVLHGKRELIARRLSNRQGHFFEPHLLAAQVETFEPPAYGWHCAIDCTPEAIVTRILHRMQGKADIAVIGLGVMGRNLVLNIADKGYTVAAYNRHVLGEEEHVARDFVQSEGRAGQILPFDDMRACLDALDTPRTVLVMVAAQAVDAVLDELTTLLSADDVVIDGGNSYFEDTQTRARRLATADLLLIGMGVSGGSSGARHGPSLMPGGNYKAFEKTHNLLEAIAARDAQGRPCCAYIGSDGAGHFVKMVHNGIEYAEMQLIAECYDLLRRGSARMTPRDIASTFEQWCAGDSASYLLEITVDILRKEKDGAPLVDRIHDVASHKGTGVHCVRTAASLGVPVDTIAAALSARQISGRRKFRHRLAERHSQPGSAASVDHESLHRAYSAARMINHAAGFDLLAAASTSYDWNLDLLEIARIWTAGCIIRSVLMQKIAGFAVYEPLLAHPALVADLEEGMQDLASVLSGAVHLGIATPVLGAAVQYLLGMQTRNSPASLIQAQRDYFGGHGIEWIA